jgi:hypothetical protein
MKDQIERIHELLDGLVDNPANALMIVPEIREVLREMEDKEPTVAEG